MTSEFGDANLFGLQAAIRDIQKNLDAKKLELNDLESKASAEERNMVTVDKTLNEAMQSNMDLRTKLAEAQSRLQLLEQERDKQMNVQRQLLKRIESLDAAEEKIQSEIHLASMSRYTRHLAIFQKFVDSAKLAWNLDGGEALEAAKAELEAQIAEKERRLEELEKRDQETLKDLRDLEAKLKDLQERMAGKDLAKLEEEHSTAQKTSLENAEKIERAKEKLRVLEMSVEEDKKKLAESEADQNEDDAEKDQGSGQFEDADQEEVPLAAAADKENYEKPNFSDSAIGMETFQDDDEDSNPGALAQK